MVGVGRKELAEVTPKGGEIDDQVIDAVDQYPEGEGGEQRRHPVIGTRRPLGWFGRFRQQAAHDRRLVLHLGKRFGDVRRLISQTLDPILTSYFRDVAQSSNMLDLLTHREDIQRRATEELGKRFREFDINCIAVLIGRPE